MVYNVLNFWMTLLLFVLLNFISFFFLFISVLYYRSRTQARIQLEITKVSFFFLLSLFFLQTVFCLNRGREYTFSFAVIQLFCSFSKEIVFCLEQETSSSSLQGLKHYSDHPVKYCIEIFCIYMFVQAVNLLIVILSGVQLLQSIAC